VTDVPGMRYKADITAGALKLPESRLIANSLIRQVDAAVRNDAIVTNNVLQARNQHHFSMYKRRPIYWLFSSGKQRAFQCLVFLHRYHEGTLARMRSEYVIPLQGQIAARIDQLEGEKTNATSTSHRKTLRKSKTISRRNRPSCSRSRKSSSMSPTRRSASTSTTA
jgi:hypothetical protein